MWWILRARHAERGHDEKSITHAGWNALDTRTRRNAAPVASAAFPNLESLL